MPTDKDKFDEDDLDALLRASFAAKGKIEITKPTGAELGEAKDAVEAQDAALENEIVTLLEQGRKIKAIKLYRKQTGAGLKEAKDAVEALAAKHGISPKGAGCAGMVLLMVMISAIIGVGVWVLPG